RNFQNHFVTSDVFCLFVQNFSMQFHHSLKNYNTFGIDVKARQFVDITTTEQLKEVLCENNGKLPLFVLSGGSNMLLTKDVGALVLYLNTKGIEVRSEEHTSELQSRENLVCRLLLEK